jgi:hypothetical protein
MSAKRTCTQDTSIAQTNGWFHPTDDIFFHTLGHLRDGLSLSPFFLDILNKGIFQSPHLHQPRMLPAGQYIPLSLPHTFTPSNFALRVIIDFMLEDMTFSKGLGE